MEEVQGAARSIFPLELDLAVTASLAEVLAPIIKPMGTEEMCNRCERIDAHLKSRCGGLLEISGGSASRLEACWDDDWKNFRPLPRVNYLHRTVKEFLEDEEVQKVLSLDTASMSDFDPHTSVLMSYVMAMKRSLHAYNDCIKAGKPPNIEDNRKDVHFALKYAVKAEASKKIAYVRVLDEFDKVVKDFRPGPGEQCDVWDKVLSGFCPLASTTSDKVISSGAPEHNSLLVAATTLHLCTYVETKLKRDPSALHRTTSPPLLSDVFRYKPTVKTFEMAQMLFTHGADPNQLWKGHTPWQQLLTQLHLAACDNERGIIYGTEESRDYLDSLIYWARVVKLMLQHGASPYTTCTQNYRCNRSPVTFQGTPSGWHTVKDVIIDVFSMHLPLETAELLHILDKQMGSTNGSSRTNTAGLETTAEIQLKRKRLRSDFEGDRDYYKRFCYDRGR